jgi:hypothetical protein
MAAVNLRVATQDDLPGIWSVCSPLFDEYSHFTYKDFTEISLHKYFENPSLSANHLFGWVLEASEGIVGFLGLVPQRFKIGNKLVTGASGTTWGVHPNYRAHSLTLYKAYMGWGDNNFLIDTTAGELASKLHSSLKLGMKKIPFDDFDNRMLWITSVKQLTRWKAQKESKPLYRIASREPFLSVASIVTKRKFRNNGQLRLEGGNLHTEAASEFGLEFDDLWSRINGQYEITNLRDSQFLRWRHSNLPKVLGESKVFACRDGGELLGFISVWKNIYKNSFPDHYVVTDIFYDRRRQDVLENLLNAAFQYAKENKASVFEVYGFNPEIRKVLETQSPYRLRTPSWTYWYKGPTDLHNVCKELEWWPSGTDGDRNF